MLQRKSCVPFRRAASGGGIKQLKRVPRVEGGNDSGEFGGVGRESAAFTRHSYFEDCKSVIWKVRPNSVRVLPLSLERQPPSVLRSRLLRRMDSRATAEDGPASGPARIPPNHPCR